MTRIDGLLELIDDTLAQAAAMATVDHEYAESIRQELTRTTAGERVVELRNAEGDRGRVEPRPTTGRQSRLPRSLHRMYAAVFGYYWAPCPVCRRPYGGHEVREVDGKPCTINGPFLGQLMICPACTRAGRGEPMIRLVDLFMPPRREVSS